MKRLLVALLVTLALICASLAVYARGGSRATCLDSCAGQQRMCIMMCRGDSACIGKCAAEYGDCVADCD